jgi:hypothetical protein
LAIEVGQVSDEESRYRLGACRELGVGCGTEQVGASSEGELRLEPK